MAQRKSEQVLERLKQRNITGLSFSKSNEAVTHICRLIPEGATVALGGSMSVIQSGLLDALRTMNIQLLDRYREGITDGEVEEMRHRGLQADILIASCNAITSDGKLVNMDGLGNRVSGMIYGPKKVILLAGVNKIVPTLEDALRRIRNTAAPANAIRLGADTPCARTGFCDEAECRPPARICCHLTIIEASRTAGRITVVLVGEDLGF